jgi:hypothetical protein
MVKVRGKRYSLSRNRPESPGQRLRELDVCKISVYYILHGVKQISHPRYWMRSMKIVGWSNSCVWTLCRGNEPLPHFCTMNELHNAPQIGVPVRNGTKNSVCFSTKQTVNLQGITIVLRPVLQGNHCVILFSMMSPSCLWINSSHHHAAPLPQHSSDQPTPRSHNRYVLQVSQPKLCTCLSLCTLRSTGGERPLPPDKMQSNTSTT